MVRAAGPLQSLRDWARLGVGRILEFMNAPGVIRNTLIEDSLSGQRVEISVGRIFVRLSVNDRDYFFDRISGRFDGTGSGLH